MPSRNSGISSKWRLRAQRLTLRSWHRTGPAMMDFQNDKSKIASRQFMEIQEFRNMIDVCCLTPHRQELGERGHGRPADDLLAEFPEMNGLSCATASTCADLLPPDGTNCANSLLHNCPGATTPCSWIRRRGQTNVPDTPHRIGCIISGICHQLARER